MAEIKSFPNNQDEYSGAEDVMRWLHGRTSGVFAAAGNAAVAALTTPGMAVTVSDGTGWLSNSNGDGVVWWNDSESVNGSKLQLAIDAADGVLNRIDRVIVEWKTTNYVDRPEIKVLKGTASSQAAAPALTNNGTLRQISLAQISVAAGTTAITASMITDERQDTEVCGLVTDGLSIDTSVINAQFSELLEQLRSAIAQAISGGLIDGSVTSEKLAALSVLATHIAQGAVTGQKIADKTITAANMADDARYDQSVGIVADMALALGHGNTVIHAYSPTTTITLTKEVADVLPNGWRCFIAAHTPITFSWGEITRMVDMSGHILTNGSGSIAIPQWGFIWLRKHSATEYEVFGSYTADQFRHTYTGTTQPSANLGADGDIYIKYNA